MIAKTVDHPAFGPCELVPQLLLIKWKTPVRSEAAGSALSAHSLKLASEKPPKGRTARQQGGRDPRSIAINESETLSWATGTGAKLNEASVSKIGTDENVEWVGSVYRAAPAKHVPESYFAINPNTLLLSEAAAAAIGGLATLDASASVDESRSKLLKGFIAVKLPNGNAIKIAKQIKDDPKTKAVAGGVRFENIPYISPTCNCGCGAVSIKSLANGRARRSCAPAPAPVIPNDSFFPSEWHLQRVNAPAAWALTEGDPNIVVAVLDQGVELLHPDLNLWPVSYSTITHTNDGSPVGDHGTACGGIIGGKIDNGVGVAGLAGGCRIMAIATNFADVQVAEGLVYAADNGARVVSMSFGVYPNWMVWDFVIIEAALQYCHEKNVVLVAASGNEDQPVSRFTGSDPRTICIGGSNRDDVRKKIGDTSSESWWGACYGPDVDVVAPCLEIYTTDRLGAQGYTPNDYDPRFNGTSSATPQVEALAGLILSVDPGLRNIDVRRIISETCDKINIGGYTYLPTAGKPYGTWNPEVGYGRINAERAVLMACSYGARNRDDDIGVDLPRLDPCCVSPSDPAWRPDSNCMFFYETKNLRVPIRLRDGNEELAVIAAYIEFRVTYQHKWCLLGKQHGPLLYTVTLLPGEKVTLYHSDRYRQITSTQERYSVQTTFMQFLSIVHQARVTGQIDALNERLVSGRSSSSNSSSGGFFGGFFGFDGGSSSSSQTSVNDHNLLAVSLVSDSFNQSLVQSSLLTHAERSITISTYQEKDSLDVSMRTFSNTNECRAVTYFVRRVMELYAASTIATEIYYRVIAPNIPPDWHTLQDIQWLPPQIQTQIKATAMLLPRVGTTVEQPKPISLPTDGVVYDPELANCCSAEPQVEAAIEIRLQKQKAEARRVAYEAEALELELQRRRLLLQRGDLRPFTPPPAVPELAPASPPLLEPLPHNGDRQTTLAVEARPI